MALFEFSMRGMKCEYVRLLRFFWVGSGNGGRVAINDNVNVSEKDIGHC